ncbi:MAG: lipocalin-like domain-containing protein, partial [Bacteroidales bacterium]
MKKLTTNIATLLIISLMSIIISSCTQNDGNIGELFGSWYIESIEIDGVESVSYDGNIFFAFQNSVTTMTQVDEYNERTTRYGSWSMTDDILYLTYADTDYLPLPATGFTAGVNACEVIQLTNDTLTLEYTT